MKSHLPVRFEPNARERIRAERIKYGKKLVVLDDDPTGSQSVYGVEVVTVFDETEYAAALLNENACCFILTNTRSLSETLAVGLNREITRVLFTRDDVTSLDIISRSDSTLRGHIVAEVAAIDDERKARLGHGFDGVLFAPAFFEAGRFTVDDVHYATINGKAVPVAETEFARDAAFGFLSSNLRDLIVEKSNGTIDPSTVHSITLEHIRVGGPAAVSEVLAGVTDGGFVVVNATEYADFEVVVLGVLEAERRGKVFLYRTAPSFVRSFLGLEPKSSLTAQDVHSPIENGHGLLVVGSHVSQTSRQVAALSQEGGMTEIELDVPTLLSSMEGAREKHIRETTRRVIQALAIADVLLFTSREFVPGADSAASLAISRSLSSAVTDVVAGSLSARPAWVIAKGGITSHDVAVRGLGIRRALVEGQMLPGIISLMRPIVASPEAIGIPFVVFAGNVGNEDTLANIVGVLRTAVKS